MVKAKNKRGYSNVYVDWVATEKKYLKLRKSKKFKNLSNKQKHKKMMQVMNNPVKSKKRLYLGQKKGFRG